MLWSERLVLQVLWSVGKMDSVPFVNFNPENTLLNSEPSTVCSTRLEIIIQLESGEGTEINFLVNKQKGRIVIVKLRYTVSEI